MESSGSELDTSTRGTFSQYPMRLLRLFMLDEEEDSLDVRLTMLEIF